MNRADADHPIREQFRQGRRDTASRAFLIAAERRCRVRGSFAHAFQDGVNVQLGGPRRIRRADGGCPAVVGKAKPDVDHVRVRPGGSAPRRANERPTPRSESAYPAPLRCRSRRTSRCGSRRRSSRSGTPERRPGDEVRMRRQRVEIVVSVLIERHRRRPGTTSVPSSLVPASAQSDPREPVAEVVRSQAGASIGPQSRIPSRSPLRGRLHLRQVRRTEAGPGSSGGPEGARMEVRRRNENVIRRDVAGPRRPAARTHSARPRRPLQRRAPVKFARRSSAVRSAIVVESLVEHGADVGRRQARGGSGKPSVLERVRRSDLVDHHHAP